MAGTLSTALFTIPLERSRYLVYAPARNAAFVANTAAVNLLADLKEGIRDAGSGPDSELFDFLRAVSVLDSDADFSADKSLACEETTVALTLVVNGAGVFGCRFCHASSRGRQELSEDYMDADVACRGVERAAQLASTEATRGIALSYVGADTSPAAWEVMRCSLEHARRRVGRNGTELHTAAEISHPLASHRIDWLTTRLDTATVNLHPLPGARVGNGRQLTVEAFGDTVRERISPLDESRLPYRVRLRVGLDHISTLADAVHLICSRHRASAVIVEPVYPMGPEAKGPSDDTVDFLRAYREAARICDDWDRDLIVPGAQPNEAGDLGGTPARRHTLLPDGTWAGCCQACSAQSGSAGGGCRKAFADGGCDHERSEYCHIVREVTKDRLLARIASAGGLAWHEPDRGARTASPLCVGDAEQELGTSHCFELSGVRNDGLREEPGIFPVVRKPWERELSRRSFLGMCLNATAALALLRQITVAEAIAGVRPANRAGTWVDPDLLSMVGIETTAGDTIEAGYHLRWFCDLGYPAEAFPTDDSVLDSFVMGNGTERLEFDNVESAVTVDEPPERRTEEEGRADEDTEPTRSGLIAAAEARSLESLRDDVVNNGVPPAFLLYRRPHHEHYDHRRRIDEARLRIARRGDPSQGDGLELHVGPARLEDVFRDAPDSLWKQHFPAASVGATRRRGLEWARDEEGEVLRISFVQPNGEGPRAVHFLRFDIRVESSRRPAPLVLLGYEGVDWDPVRRHWVEWERRWIDDDSWWTGPAVWAAQVRFVRGHYRSIELVTEKDRLEPFSLAFSYMDEDTEVADNPDDPAPGEWVPVDAVPFITALRTWDAARNVRLRHPTSNRYVDFDGLDLPDDAGDPLNFKYERLFPRIQQAFLRLRYAQRHNIPVLEAVAERHGTTKLRSRPKLWYRLWALDPIVATLVGEKYTDHPRAHAYNPPIPGTTYDYMVTTAWQPPAQRLCYIAQKVSRETTPPVLPPRELSAEQAKGLHREGDRALYRGVVSWRPPLVPEEDEDPDYHEPPLFDVRREDDDGEVSLLTHYYDENEPVPKERFVDSPVHGAVSPPDIRSEEVREELTPRQRDALRLQQVLQAQDSAATITGAQAAAHGEMRDTSLSDFFGPADPSVAYTDWLELSASQEQRSFLYEIRSIDLFGRTSDWTGPVELIMTHDVSVPEATGVRAALVAGGEEVRVSWKLGAHEARSGAPVNHFNVLWRFHDPDRDFVVMAYHDLLDRAPSDDELEEHLEGLETGTLTRRGLLIALCAGSEYLSAAGLEPGQPSREAYVRRLYRDLMRREPTSPELSERMSELESGAARGEVVEDLLKTGAYKPGSPRRFFLWKDQALASGVSRQPPVQVTPQAVRPLEGSTLYGRIEAVRARSGERARREEEALLGPGRRILSLETNQTLRGIPPFVDLPGRYGTATGLLDQVSVSVAGETRRELVGLEGGRKLKMRIAVDVPADGAPEDAVAHWEESEAFSLTFDSVRTAMEWTQTLDVDHLPDVGRAPDLPAREADEGYDQDYVRERMLERPSLRLLIPRPFEVEVTGREEWLTDEAWIAYRWPDSDAGRIHRVPVAESSTITVRPGALHFGTILVPSEDTPEEEAPPSLTMTLSNHGPDALQVDNLSTDDNAFVVESPVTPATVARGGSLNVTVRFSPSADGAADGALSIVAGAGTADESTVSVPLTGSRTADPCAVRPDPRTSPPRHFLAGLTLKPLMPETEAASEEWIPAFPGDLLVEALQEGVDLAFRVERPPIRQVTLDGVGQDDTSDDAERLLQARRAELAFVVREDGADEEVVAEVLSRPAEAPGDGGSPGGPLSFLIRGVRALPGEARIPGEEPCAFYPEYCLERPLSDLPAEVEELGGTIEVAVSSHRAPPGEGYAEELEWLVSVPAKVKVPPDSPDPPGVEVALPGEGEEWSDPFEVIYAGLPKVLDNRKLVQVRIDLEDSLSAAELDEGARYEVFRAPQDALRLLMTESGHPTEGPCAPSEGQDVEAGTSEGPSENEEPSYRDIVRRLVLDWDDSEESLKRAFRPIGRLPRDDAGAGEQSLVLTDEIEGIAGGDYFYAVRTVWEGHQPSGLQCLPFRVRVPSTAPPPRPEAARRVVGPQGPILRWRVLPDRTVDGYELYRSTAAMGPTSISGMERVAELSASDNFAPLKIRVLSGPIQSTAGTISPWFPRRDVAEVQGVYRSSDFDPTALPLTQQPADNFYRPGEGSTYAPQHSRILNVPVPLAEGRTPPPLTVVYSVHRQLKVTLPYAVSSGSLPLPRVDSILGVYLTDAFDPTRSPISDQTAQNLKGDDVVFVGHHLGGLDISDEATVTVAFEDGRVGVSYVEDLRVKDGRIFLPFGPRLQSVTAVYTVDDEAGQSNLLDTGGVFNRGDGVISGLPVADGTMVRLSLLVEDFVCEESVEYRTLRLPRALGDRSIVAVVRDLTTDADMSDSEMLEELNILSDETVRQHGSLLFASEVPDGTTVQVVAEEDGERSIVSFDDRVHQYVELGEDPQDYLYRLTSFRRVRMAGGETEVLRSPPTETV